MAVGKSPETVISDEVTKLPERDALIKLHQAGFTKGESFSDKFGGIFFAWHTGQKKNVTGMRESIQLEKAGGRR